MDTAWLLGNVLFSSIGVGYFIYGKKQSVPMPLFCGVALMVFPYFISSTWAEFLLGGVLTALPYFVRL
jgi:hypothetical protein